MPEGVLPQPAPPVTDPKTDFERLNPIRLALEERLDGAVASLMAYADPPTGGFFHLHQPKDEPDGKAPGERRDGDPSHASSATCASYLLASGRWISRVGEDKAWAPWTGRADLLRRKLIHSPWRSAGLAVGNPFTVAFLLEAVADLAEAGAMELRHAEESGEVLTRRDDFGVGTAAVEWPDPDVDPNDREDRAALDASPHSEPCRGFEVCGFDDDQIVAHWVAALGKLVEAKGGLNIDEFPPTAFLTYKAVRALKRHSALSTEAGRVAHAWALKQLHQESVALSAGLDEADPYELAYAAMTFVVTADPERISPKQRDTVRHALEQFFDKQLPDGHWQRSRALFRYPKLGMAYCYEYELLVQMLSEPDLRPYLAGRVGSLRKSFEALERNEIVLQGDLPKGGAKARGWASGHLYEKPDTPESWTAASVYHFCHEFRRYVVDEIRKTVFAYATEKMPVDGVRSTSPPKIPASELLDCPVSYDPGQPHLRQILEEELLVKVWKNARLVDQGEQLPKDTPNSAILFGPPGTSKTQLAEIISTALGWPLLELDPSHLTRDGFDRLHAETNLLFTMLAACERVVVLLDEFDELVQSREQDSLGATSRFLTTAMLPKINELAKRRRIVYVLATNHLERFDDAISREGRFDLVLPVLPPLLSEKWRHWNKCHKNVIGLLKGRGNGLTNQEKQGLGDLTFLEFRKLARQLDAAESASDVHAGIRSAVETSTMLRKTPVPSAKSKQPPSASPAADTTKPPASGESEGDEETWQWRRRIMEQLPRARLHHS